MKHSRLLVYSIGPYLLTEKCPDCGRSHAASRLERVIVHRGFARERLERRIVGPAPESVKKALARWVALHLSDMAKSIYADAERGKRRRKARV